jgi:spore germination cell wall hydrolase CwlJ-like protein
MVSISGRLDSKLRLVPALGVLFLLVSCFSLAGTVAPPSPLERKVQAAMAKQVTSQIDAEPLLFKAIPIEDAERLNAAVLADPSAIVSARPFSLGSGAQDFPTRMTALDCLTAAIYYEAATESLTGQRAVAQVVLNRVRHPAYPNSVCGVVFQGSERVTGCQFSFTCDGALSRTPSKAMWQRATGIAAAALAGYVENSVGTATHYHTTWVVPYWRSSLTKLTTIGAHIFYRWAGSTGLPSAFTQRYAGLELLPETRQPILSTEAQTMDDLAFAPEEPATAQAGPIKPQIGPDVGELKMEHSAPIAADEKRGRLAVDEIQSLLLMSTTDDGLK